MKTSKILFVFPSLNIGGAEKVTINLINELCDKGYDISVYLFRKEGGLLTSLNDNVTLFGANKASTKIAFIGLVRCIRNADYKTVVSVMDSTNIVSLISKILVNKSSIRFICISHNTFEKIKFNSALQKFIFKNLISWLYPLADKLIVISDDALKSYAVSFPNLSGRLERVYNVSISDKIYSLMDLNQQVFKSGDINIYSCGRLVEQKGYVYAIRALNILKKEFNNIKLYISGSGKAQQILEKEIMELGLERDVFLLGSTSNPYKFMSKCDVYIHPSLWDGLPTTLIEAMACGAPVVSADCDSGPREIVKHLYSGVLISPVADEKALAEGVRLILKDDILRDRLKLNSINEAQRFASSRIVPKYEAIINA